VYNVCHALAPAFARASRTLLPHLIFAVAILIGTGIWSETESYGQTDRGRDPRAPDAAGTVRQGQNSAPIGDSGFRVPIPEIRMNRIIGDRPAPRSEPKTEVKQPVSPPVEAPRDGGPTEDSVREQMREAPVVPRLPFEPSSRKPSVDSGVERPVEREAPVEERPPPLRGVPAAPEDTIEAPVPKKEILRARTPHKMPELLDTRPVKRTLTRTPLEAVDASETAPPEWIPLEPREGTEIVPSAEPGPVPRESIPEIVPPGEKPTAPEGTTPPLEKLPQPPSVDERVPSPLDDDVLESREVKDYLVAAAPVLEELSLLMTRVPSLTIEDFDPSNPNAAVVPTDVSVKMDSLKRDLQILDSKTFAIIPPQKYRRYHSRIRESISQTYQACESIINFFEGKDEVDLRKVEQHLLRARELIRSTLKRSG
jgi:hypothetical protein